MSEYKVFCIVVTYRPDAAHLQRVLASIARQTPYIFLVDNTLGPHTAIATPEGVQCIALGENLGIAAAQNIGIRQAIEQGSTEQLSEIIQIVRATGALDVTRAAAFAEARRAMAAAERLPANAHSKGLLELAAQLLARRN